MGPSGRRALSWLVALGVALVLAVLGNLVRTGLRREQRPVHRRPASRSSTAKVPGFEFQATRLRVIDPSTGRVAWELSLAQAESATGTGEVWLTGVEAAYYNSDGTVTRLTAEKGLLESGSQALVFNGGVTLSASNGGSLKAETLRWEAGREEFRATGAAGRQVTFTRGLTTLQAPEIQGDLALKRVRATGGVRFSGGQG